MKQLLKKIYKVFPFKKPIFSVLKSLFPWPNSIYKHLYFDGIISFRVKGKKIWMNQKGYDVENTLFWRGVKGCWEKVSVDLWIKLCNRSEVILDIGANTGAYSLIAKAANERAEVFAFEPILKIHKRLEANNNLNKMNIQCVPYALSNFSGTAKIYPESLDHIYSVTVNKNTSAPSIKVYEMEIQVTTLATFIEENNLKRVDLMKIDVETHEPEMLMGMGEYLFKWRPTILVEILTEEVAEKVAEIVKDMSYLYFNIDEKGSIRQMNKIGVSDYYNYLLCSPEIARYLKLKSS